MGIVAILFTAPGAIDPAEIPRRTPRASAARDTRRGLRNDSNGMQIVSQNEPEADAGPKSAGPSLAHF